MENVYDVIMMSIFLQYFRKPQFSFLLEATITTQNMI